MASFSCTVFLLVFGVLLPDNALAFQPHAYSGLYIHQFAHFFLVISLFLFAVKARQTRLASLKAWQSIIAGTWLLILWSSSTMVGHFLDLTLENSLFLPPGENIPRLRLSGWQEGLYYILKFDHLLFVPALLLFYRGLKWLREEKFPLSSSGQNHP